MSVYSLCSTISVYGRFGTLLITPPHILTAPPEQGILQRFQIEFNRFPKVLQGFLKGVPFADAAWQSGHKDGEASVSIQLSE